MIVLIESSAEYPSVAVSNMGGDLFWSSVGLDKQSHAEQLPLMLAQAVDFVRGEGNQILAVAFHQGPGSYTGLRIGVSLAKGLCYGLSVPLISVSGFEALGKHALKSNPNFNEVWVMMDARRDEVYALKCDKNATGPNVVRSVILPSEGVANYNEKTLFVGNANHKLPMLLVGSEICGFIDQSPRASQLSEMAALAYNNTQFVDLAYYEPNYLKDFVAGVSKKFSL